MARCPTRFPPPFCPALQIPTTARGAGRDGDEGGAGERKWAELRLTGKCQPIDWVRVFLFPAPAGLRVTTAAVASDRGSPTPADCGGREASQSLPGAVWRDPTVSLVGGRVRRVGVWGPGPAWRRWTGWEGARQCERPPPPGPAPRSRSPGRQVRGCGWHVCPPASRLLPPPGSGRPLGPGLWARSSPHL